MNKPPEPLLGRHAQALYRYIAGLEQGDLEAVASVLQEAEDDAELERMLLEMSDVYQGVDQGVVQPDELVSVKAAVRETLRTQLRGAAGATDAATDRATRSLLPFQDRTSKESRQPIMQILHWPATSQEQVRDALPDRAPTRMRRLGMLMQSLGAVVLVVLLAVGFRLLAAQRGNNVLGEPAAQQPSNVVAFSSDGIISTLDGRTGKIVWSYETHRQVINEEIGLVVRDQMVYGLINGHVYVLRLKDGSLVWHNDVHLTPPTYYAFNERLIVDKGVVFVGEISGQIKDLHGAVYALRASDGKLLWKYTGASYPLMTAKNGIVYVRDIVDNKSARLQALRGSDGHVLWSANIAVNSALVANDTVYALSVDASNGVRISIKAIKQGSVLWSKAISSSPLSARLYLSQGELIAGGGGRFCAYRISDGTQDWCTYRANPGTSLLASVGQEGYPDAAIADALYSVSGTPAGVKIASYRLKDGILHWSKEFSNVDEETGLRTAASFPRPVITGNVVTVIAGQKIIALKSVDGSALWQTQLSNVQILATES